MLRLLLLLCTLLTATTTLASQNLLFILDGSGSMWGRIDGEPKITVAREVMSALISDLPDNSRVGLMAYGHSRKGDCGDIETLASLGPLQRDRLIQQVQNINPKGKTPITAAVEEAVAQLRSLEDSASIVLVSDGLESCGGDPCATARAARESGVDFRLHVVGFDLGDADTGELRCMAEATGGRYFTARNAQELGAALGEAVAPPAGLRVVITANGEPMEARTYLHHASDGSEADRARTNREGVARYALEPGLYQLTVRPDGIDAPTRVFKNLEVTEGDVLEKTVDFSAGELLLKITANGVPLKARTYVHDQTSGKEAARQRTSREGLAGYEIPPGTYRVTVRPDGISAPKRVLDDVTVSAEERSNARIDFSYGSLNLTVSSDGEPLSARTYLRSADTGREIERQRTDSQGEARYEVPVGEYVLRVRPPRSLDADDRRVEGIKVIQGEVNQVSVDFSTES